MRHSNIVWEIWALNLFFKKMASFFDFTFPFFIGHEEELQEEEFFMYCTCVKNY